PAHGAKAGGAGAKTGNVAAGLERLAGGRRAVEDLEPVAAGIVEHDPGLHGALVGERARAARDLGAGRFDPGSERVERGGVRHLPAKKPMPWPPSASTTSRCLRSSMRKASEERLLSMRCRPRKFVP